MTLRIQRQIRLNSISQRKFSTKKDPLAAGGVRVGCLYIPHAHSNAIFQNCPQPFATQKPTRKYSLV